MSPTMTSVGTIAGMILGTASYMSPEQAKGKPVDRRADIWAFGVLLYEMLTGRRLFKAETVSETLAAVLRDEIVLEPLPAGTPQAVVRLLRRCLDRDSRTRLRDIGEARIALSDVASAAPEHAESAVASPAVDTQGGGSVWKIAVAVVLTAAATVALIEWRRPAVDPSFRSAGAPTAGRHGGWRGACVVA